jgi:hypothetical protein
MDRQQQLADGERVLVVGDATPASLVEYLEHRLVQWGGLFVVQHAPKITQRGV